MKSILLLNKLISNAGFDPNQKRDFSGRWSLGGAMAADKDSGRGVAQKTPSLSAKAELAKVNAVRVDEEIQRYAENIVEAQVSKSLKGIHLENNEPADVVITKNGIPAHGIEVKAIVIGKSDRIWISESARANKRKWARKNKAEFHILVADDRDVFDARGKGQHDFSKRVWYYKRSYGSNYRLKNLHRCEDFAEVRKLISSSRKDLPKAAK